MLKKYKVLESGRRKLNDDANALATYEKAVAYLAEKRKVLERLNEINRELRKLYKLDSEVLAVAQDDVPFRKTPGRKKGDTDI